MPCLSLENRCACLACFMLCSADLSCRHHTSPTEEGSWMASELPFFFQVQSYSAQVFQEGERIPGVFGDLHTHPSVWLSLGRKVCAASATCLQKPQQSHNLPGFLYGMLFGQSFSCRWSLFAGSGIFHMRN